MSALKGKVAIVTGASKGIGAAIAKGLAAGGASVVVNYASSKEGADRVVAEIVGKGGKAIAVEGDASKAADVQRLFAATKKAFGSLDVLVNNAGVYRFAPLEEVTEDEFHRQFNINVLGVLLASREAMKFFGSDGGSVINISSMASMSPTPTAVVYSATKGAVDTITRVLAGPQENPGQRDQSGRRRDRGRAQHGDDRQRLRETNGGAHAAGTPGAAGRHRVGRGVSGVPRLRLDDGRDDRRRRRLLLRHWTKPRIEVALAILPCSIWQSVSPRSPRPRVGTTERR
jgi:NADP-dependent 3-hydroxy acid dehydrogenase YdfG